MESNLVSEEGIFKGMPAQPDHVSQIMAQWNRERPDVDVTPMGVIGRLHRLSERLHEELAPVFAEAGLSDGDFDVLATLRRSGPPYQLTPGEISESTMVTSGAVTKRVDRLLRAGLVDRTVCQHDARSRRVGLTDQGLELIDELLPLHVANEARLLAGLSDLERTRLAGLLEHWGRTLE